MPDTRHGQHHDPQRDDRTQCRLRLCAARHARPLEEETRSILEGALSQDAPAAANLTGAIRARFRAIGGIDLVFAPRDPVRKPRKPAKWPLQDMRPFAAKAPGRRSHQRPCASGDSGYCSRKGPAPDPNRPNP